MEKLKVVHVIWSATAGGIEKLVLDLTAEQLKNQALDVSILIARPEGDFLDKLRNAGVKLHLLGMKSGSDVSPGCYRAARKIFHSCDIIHIHSFNPLIAAAASNSGRKIIYTEHGNFGFGRSFSVARQVVLSLQKHFLNTRVHYITFTSEFTRETAEKRYGLVKVKKKVVYNGITLPYKAMPVNDDAVTENINGCFIAGTVARIAPVKKIDRLIHAFALFAGEKNTRLLIIGDGPLLPEMKNLAKAAGIMDKTIFAGYRSNARDYYPLMDVVAITTAGESFGIAAVEALDAGKPVIAYADGGGVAEIIGSRFPEDIVENDIMLAQRLDHYYRHASSGGEVEARKAIASTFSISKMQEEIFNIYQSV